MPDRNDCMLLNDRMMLSRNRRNARAEHCQRYYDAIRRIEERRENRLLRRAKLHRVLDGALLVLCMMAVAVTATVMWAV